jgi:hypothetical protein
LIQGFSLGLMRYVEILNTISENYQDFQNHETKQWKLSDKCQNYSHLDNSLKNLKCLLTSKNFIDSSIFSLWILLEIFERKILGPVMTRISSNSNIQVIKDLEEWDKSSKQGLLLASLISFIFVVIAFLTITSKISKVRDFLNFFRIES